MTAFFWSSGILLAAAQAWGFRYHLSADSVSYLDMSDAVLPGFSWLRLINGTWSPLYPFLLGALRRVFNIAPANEVVAAHLLNIVFFIFAFLCFEFFLKSLLSRSDINQESAPVLLPRWACIAIAYSLFLWGSLSAISLQSLRADMLMSGFAYLAVGMLLRMHGQPARWKDYLALGVVLGIGFLAKAPILPIGVLVLASSLLLVKDWRPALIMAAGSLALTLLISCLYIVPLSKARGHLTFGETGGYNYLVHVDRAHPNWYMQHPGNGKGSFSNPPEKIFPSPPVYAFDAPYVVTHPLRFDPAIWTAGVKPRFALKRQIGESLSNLFDLGKILRPLWLLAAAILVLGFTGRRANPIRAALTRNWPALIVGLAGCAMYVAVHLEARYVGAFVALFWCGLAFSFLVAPRRVDRRLLLGVTILIVVSLLAPGIMQAYTGYFRVGRGPNPEAQAAAELQKTGIQPGDRVARISSMVTDLGLERTARVEIISEVDLGHAKEFWKASLDTQHQILELFVSRGAKAVIATSPQLNATNQSDWKQLGSTQYWAWLPARQ